MLEHIAEAEAEIRHDHRVALAWCEYDAARGSVRAAHSLVQSTAWYKVQLGTMYGLADRTAWQMTWHGRWFCMVTGSAWQMDLHG